MFIIFAGSRILFNSLRSSNGDCVLLSVIIKNVVRAMYAAEHAGLEVKVNTVIIRGWNDDEIVDFAKFARCTGYTVRFIEFMPLDGTGMWEPNLVVSKRETIQRINEDLKELKPLYNKSSEPATLYSFVDGEGILGFIPSITELFCENCDRMSLRLLVDC